MFCILLWIAIVIALDIVIVGSVVIGLSWLLLLSFTVAAEVIVICCCLSLLLWSLVMVMVSVIVVVWLLLLLWSLLWLLSAYFHCHCTSYACLRCCHWHCHRYCWPCIIVRLILHSVTTGNLWGHCVTAVYKLHIAVTSTDIKQTAANMPQSYSNPRQEQL